MVSFSFSGIELHVLDIVFFFQQLPSWYTVVHYIFRGVKTILISKVNVNFVCLMHKPVCRSIVLWQHFATWQICLFYLACVVSFFREWLLLYLIVTFGNLIQNHLKHWLELIIFVNFNFIFQSVSPSKSRCSFLSSSNCALYCLPLFKNFFYGLQLH